MENGIHKEWIKIGYLKTEKVLKIILFSTINLTYFSVYICSQTFLFWKKCLNQCEQENCLFTFFDLGETIVRVASIYWCLNFGIFSKPTKNLKKNWDHSNSNKCDWENCLPCLTVENVVFPSGSNRFAVYLPDVHIWLSLLLSSIHFVKSNYYIFLINNKIIMFFKLNYFLHISTFSALEFFSWNHRDFLLLETSQIFVKSSLDIWL